jgi:hypothetical protein
MEEIFEEKVLHVFRMHQHIPLKTKCVLCGLFLMKYEGSWKSNVIGNTAHLQWP